jgi:hypothetical protein
MTDTASAGRRRYGGGRRGEGNMPAKTPQKPSAKKVGKSLKEKREAKKAKKAGRKPLAG